MNPWPVDAEVEESTCRGPGHADLAGSQKYGHSATSATCSSAPARARPRRASPPARSRRSSCGALGVSVHSHVLRIASVRAPERRRPRPGGLRRASTSRRCAASTPRPSERDGRRDRPAAQGEREPRRHLRGARLRARPGPRLARLLGRAARRPPRAGDRLDPGGQGRLRRRGVGRRGRPRLGGPRRDLLDSRSAAVTARRTAPAASRAACRTASRSSSRAR